MSKQGRGGFRGGPPGGGGMGGFDPMKMLGAAQEQQKKAAEELEKELAQKTLEGAAGGGMVQCVVSGTLDVRSIKLDPSVVDKAEKDMLEDLVVAAVNAALKKAKELQAQAQAEMAQKQIQQMLGGMGGMGGLEKLLGGM
ncbi:MAG TPA: YbaB/EbfC family nucleoid-associated protein [Planctomycetota bacterium]|nr:YbaB/EbfC family nucleoid-associated protein [Planctomycetota bacterium]